MFVQLSSFGGLVDGSVAGGGVCVGNVALAFSKSAIGSLVYWNNCTLQ
ncbi:MAG: hypothetical protein LBP53_04655 [Candidatus Peribacteria bacterium]|nr:hypothetical protein [Candidatus Peribacteria bacterium]